MYLKKLEIIGFKSFARKTVLEFPQKKGKDFSVTSIVGPNGSGKSNILESIRWALGEQSLKSLRGKKSQDIIFSGSDKKNRLNLAEVTLFFNNEDKIAPIDYKEFTITRRLYRNGENEYLLNKNRVRLQDIIILLAKSNFGQKSYSIVSQGLVDQILQNSPVERKRFFDEATGIRQYQIKKENALKKIDRSHENLKQASIALAEIKPRLNSLTRQINRLEKRQETEKKLLDLQKKYYGSQWNNLKYQKNKAKDKIREKKEIQNNLEKELNQIQKESESLVYEKPNEQYQDLQKKYQEIINKKNNYFVQQSTIQAKLAFEEEKREREKTKKDQLEDNQKIEVNQEELFKSLKKIEKEQGQFLENLNSISKIEEINNIQDLARKILNQINYCLKKFKIIKNNTEPKKEQEIQNKKIDELKEKNLEFKGKINELDKKLEEINKQINQFGEKEKEKRYKMLEWQKKIKEKQSSLNEINYSINEIQIDLARVETKQEILEKEIEEETGAKIKEDIKNNSLVEKEIIEDYSEEIRKFKNQLELIGSIDPEITKEYPLVKEKYEFLKNQSEDLIKTIRSLNKIIKELEQKIKSQFQGKFNKISQEFDRYFKIIFGGGRAKLIFQKSLNLKENQKIEDVEDKNNDHESENENNLDENEKIENSEINILANPPSKKIKNIEMLSGGEKALTSLALICSIISINRPPFVILDEVDAALDQENSFRFAKILQELKQNTQFIVITHNQQTIETSDILYGITMRDDGISKLISLKLK